MSNFLGSFCNAYKLAHVATSFLQKHIVVCFESFFFLCERATIMKIAIKIKLSVMIYAETTHAIIFYEVYKKEYSKKKLIVLLFLIKFECGLNNT